MWMNEMDIEMALRKFDNDETPNLGRAAGILHRLMEWTNDNSDGWPYWKKPANAADTLMMVLTHAQTSYYEGTRGGDITDAELKATLRPVKSFLTRQGVAHAEIIG